MLAKSGKLCSMLDVGGAGDDVILMYTSGSRNERRRDISGREGDVRIWSPDPPVRLNPVGVGSQGSLRITTG